MRTASRPAARWRQTVWGELLSEFLGTFVLIALGDGVVAMAVAALNQSGRGTEIFAASGDWLLIGWGWGFAVTFGVYVVYKGAIDSYERAHDITRGAPDSVTTYSIFATFPAPYFGNWVGPFVDQ